MSPTLSSKKPKNHREGGHPFKTVTFPDDKQPKRSIDIAPSFWIFHSRKLKGLACPFPVGPFSPSEATDLHRRFKNCDPPDMAWPVHRVIINGRAWTYAEACDAVDKLEHDTYAFSTDRESSVERIVEEENQKTLDEELDEAACAISVNSGEVFEEKIRGNLQTDPKNQKSSHDPSSLLSGSESSSDKANIRSQKKPVKKRTKKKKKSSMSSSNSSSDSLSNSVSPKVLEKGSTKTSSQVLSSSRKSSPPDNSSTESPLKSPSPPLSEDELLLQDLQRENEVLKRKFQRTKTAQRIQRVTSPSPPPSGSRSPKKSIPKDLTRQISPKVLEKDSTKASSQILSSSQKSSPSPNNSSTESPLKCPPPLSEDELLLQDLQRENELLKREFQRMKTAQRNQRVASPSPPPSGSRSPKKSIPKDLTRQNSVKISSAPQESVPSTSAQKMSSHGERSNSRIRPTIPSTKRPNSEMGGSSPQDEERTFKHTKIDRRSRSKERKRLQIHHETRDLSGDNVNLNRSRSAENSTPHKEHEHRRSSSLHDLQDQHHHHSARKAILEAQNFAALEESLVKLVTKMHHSLSNKIDRLHGAQVETGGKLDHLQEIVSTSLPVQEGSPNDDDDDDNDVDDPNAIILPIETKEQFLIFDARLKDDKEYRKTIKKRIKNMVPKPRRKYSTHNLSVIVRVFLTQQLLKNNFVALKKSSTKDALIDTNFCKCLRGVHQAVRGDEMDEETFNGYMKGMFNAAGDWDGARTLRRPN